MVGDTGIIKEGSTTVTRTSNMGRNHHQYSGWNSWFGIAGYMKRKQRIIAELTSMDLEDSEGVHWARMEPIKGFLIYVASKYKYMNNYLTGLHLTIDVWILYRYK